MKQDMVKIFQKKKQDMVKIFHKPPAAHPLPPKPTGRNHGLIHEDSSWITNPNNAKVLQQRTKKSIAMKAMTKAFVESMRCSLEEAECQTSKKERIDCIDFGKLLVALDLMKDCMKAYGMTRTTADLEHHARNAKMLHMATPPEERDYLLSLLEQQAPESSQESAKGNSSNTSNNQLNMPFIRAFSISESHDESPTLESPEAQAQSCTDALLSDANTAASIDPSMTLSPTKNESERIHPCLLETLDRKKARNSMFWLCYFVRYTYNVHRNVLQVGHDAVDASAMAFMKFLHPFFGDYYTETKDAKAFLNLLTDYQKENYLVNDAGSGGLDELKSFLGVIEVVMYLWTPAFEEMVLS